MSDSDKLGSVRALAEQFEQASQAYVGKFGLQRDPDWFILKLQEEVGELTQAWTRVTGRGRVGERSETDLRDQLADEVADVFGHVMLLALNWGIDLPPAVHRKWRFDMNPQPISES
jgi:NTP pyrophosphatase (non-canonical NTP hydrolase)